MAITQDDPFDLNRFVNAQAPVYAQVVGELRRGRKTGHWMWFIFPQLRGLGHSEMAQHYGIASRQEAAAYLSHPLLGGRLTECTELVLAVEGATLSAILGYPDDLKFGSCMTLFAAVAPEQDVFKRAITKFLAGERDPRTLQLLSRKAT